MFGKFAPSCFLTLPFIQSSATVELGRSQTGDIRGRSIHINNVFRVTMNRFGRGILLVIPEDVPNLPLALIHHTSSKGPIGRTTTFLAIDAGGPPLADVHCEIPALLPPVAL